MKPIFKIVDGVEIPLTDMEIEQWKTPVADAIPTKAELMAQLAVLTAQIQALE